MLFKGESRYLLLWGTFLSIGCSLADLLYLAVSTLEIWTVCRFRDDFWSSIFATGVLLAKLFFEEAVSVLVDRLLGGKNEVLSLELLLRLLLPFSLECLRTLSD